MCLLAAEITAVTGKNPQEHYNELAKRFGAPSYNRLQAAATSAQKAALSKLSPEMVSASTLAGDPITAPDGGTGQWCFYRRSESDD